MIGADKFVMTLKGDQQSLHATQRYARGFSDIDMWNLDGFIADVIVAGCEWHLAHAHATPWHFEKGEWHSVLARIRDGFARKNEDTGAPDPTDEAWELLRENFKFLWY